MNGIMIYFTDTGKQAWVNDCTPDQFRERLARGDFAHLRLDRPAVRIEHGQSAGAKFISEGMIPNPSAQTMAQAKAAAEAAAKEREAAAVKKHEPKAGDTLVIAGREYVIGEDGEPVLVSGTEPKPVAKPKAKRGKKQEQEAEAPDPADATGDTEPAADGTTDPAE